MHGALLDPRVPAPHVEERWGGLVKSRDEVKKRWIGHNLDQQHKYMVESAKGGNFGARFRTNDAGIWASSKDLLESNTTLTADITTFTQQALAMVEMIFERIVIDRLVTVSTMSGPTAFVFNLGFDSTEKYAGQDAPYDFNLKLDPDYADCPTECTASNGADFKISKTTITADCKRLKAKYSVPAEQDLQSQYGMSLGDRLRQFMALEIQREIQGEILAALIAGAANNVAWNATPAGVFANLDPKIWQATLYDAIAEADNDIFKSTDGYRSANWIAGSPDALLYLTQLKQFSITSRDNPRLDAGEGDIDEYANFFGQANHKYDLWKFPFMTANILLLGVKSDAPQEQGFIHATYIPLSDLGTFRDPETACVTSGVQTRYGNALLRPGLYATVTITP